MSAKHAPFRKPLDLAAIQWPRCREDRTDAFIACTGRKSTSIRGHGTHITLKYVRITRLFGQKAGIKFLEVGTRKAQGLCSLGFSRSRPWCKQSLFLGRRFLHLGDADHSHANTRSCITCGLRFEIVWIGVHNQRAADDTVQHQPFGLGFDLRDAVLIRLDVAQVTRVSLV